MARKTLKEPKVRASWRGMLRFGLVTFPVEAFNARSREEGEVHFHQLHAECHSRIQYEKHCPIHGRVSNDEIVSGYEYGKGKYVEVEPEELDALRTDREKSLTIDTFIEPEQLDPIYMDGRMYYLAPAGPEATEAYQVFVKALVNQGRYGVGQVVFSGKDQVVLVRPYEGALHMAMLNYEAEIRPVTDVLAELPSIREVQKKVKLAEALIDTWSEHTFDFSKYEDQYVERVKELIEAKIEGREIVAPEAEEPPDVINLVDALRKSVAQATHDKPERHVSRAVKEHKPKVHSVARRRAKPKNAS